MRRFYLQIMSTNIAIPTSFSASNFGSYRMAEDAPRPPRDKLPKQLSKALLLLIY